MTNFPKARECSFLKPEAQISAVLPPELSLVRDGGKFLAFTLSGDLARYALGVTRDGWLAGFPLVFGPENRAAIVILKNPAAGGCVVFRAKDTPSIPFDQIVEVSCPPSGDFSTAYGLSPLPQGQKATQSAPKLVFAANGFSAGTVGNPW